MQALQGLLRNRLLRSDAQFRPSNGFTDSFRIAGEVGDGSFDCPSMVSAPRVSSPSTETAAPSVSDATLPKTDPISYCELNFYDGRPLLTISTTFYM
jgi:hypothetical protein